MVLIWCGGIWRDWKSCRDNRGAILAVTEIFQSPRPSKGFPPLWPQSGQGPGAAPLAGVGSAHDLAPFTGFTPLWPQSGRGPGAAPLAGVGRAHDLALDLDVGAGRVKLIERAAGLVLPSVSVREVAPLPPWANDQVSSEGRSSSSSVDRQRLCRRRRQTASPGEEGRSRVVCVPATAQAENARICGEPHGRRSGAAADGGTPKKEGHAQRVLLFWDGATTFNAKRFQTGSKIRSHWRMNFSSTSRLSW